MTSATLNALDRVGLWNNSDNTLQRTYVGGAYAANNVGTIGQGSTASGNIYMSYKLKTVTR